MSFFLKLRATENPGALNVGILGATRKLRHADIASATATIEESLVSFEVKPLNKFSTLEKLPRKWLFEVSFFPRICEFIYFLKTFETLELLGEFLMLRVIFLLANPTSIVRINY